MEKGVSPHSLIQQHKRCCVNINDQKFSKRFFFFEALQCRPVRTIVH